MHLVTWQPTKRDSSVWKELSWSRLVALFFCIVQDARALSSFLQMFTGSGSLFGGVGTAVGVTLSHRLAGLPSRAGDCCCAADGS